MTSPLLTAAAAGIAAAIGSITTRRRRRARGASRGWAVVAAAAMLLAAGCTGTATAAGTQVVDVRLLGADGRVSPEWTITSPTSTSEPDLSLGIDCSFAAASLVATGPNIQACGGMADGAQVCWAPPGKTSLFCGDDPWSRTVRKLFATAPLAAVAAPVDPVPWGLELADGSHCTLWREGTLSPSSDGTSMQAYECAQFSPTPFVFAKPGQPAVNKSGPVWTVLGGDIAHDKIKPAPPVSIAVLVAYYAA